MSEKVKIKFKSEKEMLKILESWEKRVKGNGKIEYRHPDGSVLPQEILNYCNQEYDVVNIGIDIEINGNHQYFLCEPGVCDIVEEEDVAKAMEENRSLDDPSELEDVKAELERTKQKLRQLEQVYLNLMIYGSFAGE